MPIMFCVVVRGSENRRPSFNFLFFFAWLMICCPSLASAVLRPKGILRKMISGFPTLEGPITENEMYEEKRDFGGGAINEKKRRYKPPYMEESSDTEKQEDASSPSKPYDPSKYLAHLYHSLEGLDRYPNYMGRWTADDMDSLEKGLEEQLARVREQRKNIAEKRKGVQEIVKVLLTKHEDKERWRNLLKPCETWDEVREKVLAPQAAKAIFGSRMFKSKQNNTVPSVEEVLSGHVKVELDAAQLEELLDEECYDVFSFNLFSKEFCKEIREFGRAFWSLCETLDDAKKEQIKGFYSFNFDVVGLGWLNDLLFHLVLRPTSRQLYQDSESLLEDLDWRHGYIAGYSATPGAGKPRERLVTHTDDSEVTLNIGLGDVFEGGLLEFRGLRGTPEEGQLLGTVQPEVGKAVVHAGRHFHDVTQVESGDRFAYIMWTRSWSGIRSETCPCCYLNRRQDTACICGPRWN